MPVIKIKTSSICLKILTQVDLECISFRQPVMMFIIVVKAYDLLGFKIHSTIDEYLQPG